MVGVWQGEPGEVRRGEDEGNEAGAVCQARGERARRGGQRRGRAGVGRELGPEKTGRSVRRGPVCEGELLTWRESCSLWVGWLAREESDGVVKEDALCCILLSAAASLVAGPRAAKVRLRSAELKPPPAERSSSYAQQLELVRALARPMNRLSGPCLFDEHASSCPS